MFNDKESACQCRRCRFHPWVRKISGRRKWPPHLYSCLGNPRDRGAWQATVHGVAKELDMTATKTTNNNTFFPFYIATCSETLIITQHRHCELHCHSTFSFYIVIMAIKQSIQLSKLFIHLMEMHYCKQ